MQKDQWDLMCVNGTRRWESGGDPWRAGASRTGGIHLEMGRGQGWPEEKEMGADDVP